MPGERGFVGSPGPFGPPGAAGPKGKQFIQINIVLDLHLHNLLQVSGTQFYSVFMICVDVNINIVYFLLGETGERGLRGPPGQGEDGPPGSPGPPGRLTTLTLSFSNLFDKS